MSSAILNASVASPSGSKPRRTEYRCGVIAEYFPEAIAEDRDLAPEPVAVYVPGEGGDPMIQMPEPPSEVPTYDTVCSRFPVKETGMVADSVPISTFPAFKCRERKRRTMGLDVKP